MNKAINYAIKGGILVGLVKALINANAQLENKKPNIAFDWTKFLKEFGKGAAIGAVGGFVISSFRDEKMTKILGAAGGTSGVINKILNNYSNNEDISLRTKAEHLQNKLFKEFSQYLSQFPAISGSSEEGTAIVGSDIDIQVKFKKNAGTIPEVRHIVEDFFNNKFKDYQLTKIRSQNHSIGLFFKFGANTKRIDIVPMREIENGQGDTFIYSMNDSTIKKTNAKKQQKALSFSQKERNIIMLLKGWKSENNITIPSVLIKFLVKRAFNEINVPRARDKALLSIVKYIADKIKTIRVVDPSNTNNIISESLSYEEKVSVQNFCIKMIDDISKDKRNFLDYFPNYE